MVTTTITAQAQLPGRTSFIKKLNPDVLHVIFEMVKDGEKGEDPNRPLALKRLLNVMFTCKTWRELIVSNRSLWLDFKVRLDVTMEETLMLARAFRSSLMLPNTGTFQSGAYGDISAWVGGLRTLDVKHNDTYIRELVAVIERLPTTMLEQLVLKVDEEKHLFRTGSVKLRLNRFAGANLTRLSLRCVNFNPSDLEIVCSPSLKHLSLEYLPDESKLTWAQSMAFLKAHLSLRSLKLTDAIHGNDNAAKPLNQQSEICLKRLQSLAIVPNTMEDLNDFLTVVKYSRRVQFLKLGTKKKCVGSVNQIYDAVCRALEPCAGKNPRMDITKLRIDHRDGRGIARMEPSRPVVQGFGARGLCLDIDFPYENSKAMVEAVVDALDLENLTHLDRGRHLTAQDLKTHFAPLSNLQTLSLCGSDMTSSLVQVLQNDLESFPALMKLEIRNRAPGSPRTSDRDAIRELRGLFQTMRVERNTEIRLRFEDFDNVEGEELFADI